MATFYNGKVVTDGLVLALDAGNIKSYPQTGTIWNDLSGNGNTGTLTNGPSFNSDNGGSIVFDGTNDVVDCGNPSSLTLGSEGTLSAWIKTSREYPSNTSSTTFRGIMGKVAGGGTGQQSYYLDWYGDNGSSRVLRLGIGDVNGQTQRALGNFNFANTWTYVVGTWNGSVALLYVNGILRSSGANSRVAQTISNPLRLGQVFGFWEGSIAQTQVYNRYFTATEILQNFNATRSRFGV